MKVYRIAINMINQTKILKFIIPIVVFILLYAVSTIRNNNVRKDGIYSIVTLIKYGSAYIDTVPSWFTLKAPDKGWKILPTQKQLRIMMKDSLI